MLMLKFDLPRVPISGEGTGIFFSAKKLFLFYMQKSSSVCEIESKGGGGRETEKLFQRLLRTSKTATLDAIKVFLFAA